MRLAPKAPNFTVTVLLLCCYCAVTVLLLCCSWTVLCDEIYKNITLESDESVRIPGWRQN